MARKGNKHVSSLSIPRQVTRTEGRHDERAPARAYEMKAVEDTESNTIVSALIDPGSTHSYICTNIPSLGNLPRSETEYDILVTNPLGHSVIVNRVYRDCPSNTRI